MQVPVVAFAADSVAEAVGDTGLLVPIGDAAGLADAVDLLLRDPAQRAELARRGRQRFDDQFTLKRSMEGMRRFYVSAAADARRGYRDRLAWLRRAPVVTRWLGAGRRDRAGP